MAKIKYFFTHKKEKLKEKQRKFKENLKKNKRKQKKFSTKFSTFLHFFTHTLKSLYITGVQRVFCGAFKKVFHKLYTFILCINVYNFLVLLA